MVKVTKSSDSDNLTSYQKVVGLDPMSQHIDLG